jgi:hypothetical protein
MSIKDWWVGHREQVLNIQMACRRHGPDKPSSQLSTEGLICPHCFNGWIGRETGYGPTDRLAVVLWIGSGALFLRSSDPAQFYWRLHERLLYVDYARYAWSRVIREPSMESVWHVGWVFPCRVYIDLNHHDSQIWVSLVHGRLHVVNYWNVVY